MTHAKHFREVRKIASDCGIDSPDIIHGRVHPKISGTVSGRRIRLAIPGSPSDWRALRNLKCQIRRMVMEIRDKHGANIDLIFFDPDDINIPRLVRGMFEIGYVTGQVHAAKGEWLPDVGTQAEIVTQNDTSAKSEAE